MDFSRNGLNQKLDGAPNHAISIALVAVGVFSIVAAFASDPALKTLILGWLVLP